MLRRVILVEDWAEIRRLHRAEGVSISEIARRMGLARNTVKAALRSERPPRYERPARGSLADAVEPAVRALLADHPRMPATVIAERIGWTHSMTTLKDRLRQIRPEYLGVDPVDRIVYEPRGDHPVRPVVPRHEDPGRVRAGPGAAGAGDGPGLL